MSVILKMVDVLILVKIYLEVPTVNVILDMD